MSDEKDDGYIYLLQQKSVSKECDQPKGTGFLPAFHALWHLPELRVVQDLESFASDHWDDADKGAYAPRIAIIDTPVDHKHPNLAGAIDTGLMRDFSNGGTGNFVVREWADLPQEDSNSRIGLLDRIGDEKDGISKAIRDEVNWVEDKSKNLRPAGVPRVAPSRLYGAHGTAVAGLIGARPTVVKLRHPQFTPPKKKDQCNPVDNPVDLELPYCGINPFCRIVPISVTAVPGPDMILGALEYAKLVEPDIVVMADSWDGALGADGELSGEWLKVDEALAELCSRHIVLCAAGNDALDEPVYPASRCNDKRLVKVDDKVEERDAPGPWAVGACGTNGKDLTYSPVQSAIVGNGGWMIKTLSTEVPIFDRERILINPWEIADDLLGQPNNSEPFPPADIVTTDLPGEAGYNPSPYRYRPDPDQEYYEIASLFCRFAGTSAAVAIAAGLVSLIPNSERRPNGRPAGKPSEKGMDKLFGIDLARELFKNT
jgi:subtilisin family serine protease